MGPGDKDGRPVTPLERSSKQYMEQVQLMKAKRKARSQKSERILVKAAEKEVLLVHKEHKLARFAEVCSEEEKWARFDEAFWTDNPAGQSNLTGASISDFATETTKTREDYRDDHVQARGQPLSAVSSGQQEGEESTKGKQKESSSSFLGRCNIHWIDMSAPPAPKKKAVKTNTGAHKLLKPSDASGRRRCSHNRRVVFHRYDELIDDDGKKDYIYSLHEREVEEELGSYDVMDRVETAASDVRYFFSLLRKDLQAEAFNRIGRLRKTERGVKKGGKRTTSSLAASSIKGDSARTQPQATV